jgi:PRTRC genetic system protein B
MNDNTLYLPKAAFVVFTAQGQHPYIEYYEVDGAGCPVNPRPLTVKEAQSLSKALDTRQHTAKAFLRPEGLLSPNILHIDSAANGSVLWCTSPQKQKLYFSESLGIQSAAVSLPALVWKADKKHLAVFALKGKNRPKDTTPLYHAPFFNLYQNGNVCMGNVDVHIREAASLEEFIAAWQKYFFGSYFSHHIGGHNPLKENLISQYRKLISTGKDFPADKLIRNGLTLKNLL